MKILIVITRFEVLGGAQVHVSDLCRGLVSRGHKVSLIVGSIHPALATLIDDSVEITVIDSMLRSISPINDLRSALKLFRLIRQTEPDLISVHSAKASVLVRTVNILTRVPIVFTVHGWSFTEGISFLRRKFNFFIEWLLIRFTTSVIVVSDYDKKLAKKNGIKCKRGIYVVKNCARPYDETRGSNRFKSEFEDLLDNNKLKIVCVARFDKPKDHIALIKAVASIKTRGWVLFLVGDGPLRASCKALVEQLGIEENVGFLGQRDDVRDILSCTDVFTLISKWEGLPISIIEAMSHGLPIIASNVGGVSELVSDGENGFLVDYDKSQIKTIANRIQRFIDDRTLLSSMGEKSRKEFEQQFTFDKMIDNTENVFAKAVVAE